MSKKIIRDFKVCENLKLNDSFSLLILRPATGEKLNVTVEPGQFVQIKIPESATTLRRPISICNYIEENDELWLLVRKAGKGTEVLCGIREEAVLNLILPLGTGFKLPQSGEKILLAGGGAGMAPLLYSGKIFNAHGANVSFLLGARTANDIFLLEEYKKYGNLNISTENGSLGEAGLITFNSVLKEDFDMVYCCGPLPMMKAIAKICKTRAIECEVSLENTMGCGIGACLCCVEKTTQGNKCVCTEGPVFNVNQLTWEI